MATHSYGTMLEYDTGSAVYAELTGILTANWDPITIDVVISKPLRATNAVVNKTAGFIDEGSVSGDAEYLKTQWALWDGFGRTAKTFRLTYADSETNVFSGIVEELTRPQSGEDIHKFSFKIAVISVSDDPE